MWPFSKKEKLPAKRMYSGAASNRLVFDWVTSTTSQDAEIRGSLLILRNRSRDLGRNNDYIKNAFREIQNNVIGRGVRMQSLVMAKRGRTSGQLDEKTNNAIESAWAKWSRKENCDTAGKLNFNQIERLVVKSVAESGEVLVRKILKPMGNMKIPFALEIIEADMLDETFNSISQEGNEIRMGVEINEWKRPVAYHFRWKHPGDFFDTVSPDTRTLPRRRVLAEEIIHLFNPDRISQTRGIPWLASAMIRVRHMSGYEEAEVVAARATAALMGFIESPEGEISGDDIQDEQKVTDFEPGVFKYLAPGEKASVPPIQRPGGQFDPFMRAMLRGVAAGIGCSYETISKDYSQSNYSSSRMSLLSERDNWRIIQGDFISNFHQIIFEAWLDMAVLCGELPFKDYESNPEAYKYPKWVARGWAWIDPAKEVAAFKDAVRNGFTTLTEVISQSGGDIEDTFSQRSRELEMADELGIVLDSDPSKVNDKGITQPSVPPNVPVTESEDDDSNPPDQESA
jgi:lambda family phage portal protein